MNIQSPQLDGIPISARTRKHGWLLSMAALGLVIPWTRAASPPIESGRTLDRQIVPAKGPEADSSPAPEARPVSTRPAVVPAAPRVASNARHPVATHPTDRGQGANAGPAASSSAADAIGRAKKAIADCQERYRQIQDYTCTFVKRERIEDRLTSPHMMTMKARTSPHSLYFKFHQPNRGREAIYIQGRYNGRIVAHDVGLGKFLAGTMHLDPRGSMAMEENRHPVTEAGIGALIDTVARRWGSELSPGESVVSIHPEVRVAERACTLIESVHPERGPEFLFHKVKLYVDKEQGLPIRFEAFDWPKAPGRSPELVEEYSFLDLKTNVGLRDCDFDPSNERYSFGRL
jgi:outer membrane lipoprotein-sorting protein